MTKFICILVTFISFSTISFAAEIPSDAALKKIGVTYRVTIDKHATLNTLYLEQDVHEPTDIINAQGRKRMVIVNTGKEMSSRWLKKHIIEDIMLNSDLNNYSDARNQLNQLTELFNDPLLSYDQITFELNGNNQTMIFINKIQAAGYYSSDIFDLMLSSWIGHTPPSRSFKQEIMGNQVNQKALDLEQQIINGNRKYYRQVSGI
jgi:hypothetical protein